MFLQSVFFMSFFNLYSELNDLIVYNDYDDLNDITHI